MPIQKFLILPLIDFLAISLHSLLRSFFLSYARPRRLSSHILPAISADEGLSYNSPPGIF